jgi:hypothetical protein
MRETRGFLMYPWTEEKRRYRGERKVLIDRGNREVFIDGESKKVLMKRR